MKYLPLPELDNVTGALNFDTADCHVVGGCDLYITKAAGGDKKLYKNIENSLESQYENLLRFSASLSPPQATNAAAALNLSRASPFGPLSQISSRRTFAYLIATLNASHPDYDFSHILQPTDFRRERSLKLVMNTLDMTLYNLRPKPIPLLVNGPQWSSSVLSTAPPTPGGSQVWSPRMWRAIDKEMSLKDCSVYSYVPEEDPCDDEEASIWSFHYFFFNKAKKRVCYLYLRGLSIISQGAVERAPTPSKRVIDLSWAKLDSSGASKRARYWLGDRATGEVIGGWNEEDDDIPQPHEPRLLSDGEDFRSTESIYDSPSPHGKRSPSLSPVRGISEDIADAIQV